MHTRWGLCWLMMEVYLWMIIIRIFASWVIPLSHPWVSLWVIVTDPAVKPLEQFLPMVTWHGRYFYDLPIVGLLLALVLAMRLGKGSRAARPGSRMTSAHNRENPYG